MEHLRVLTEEGLAVRYPGGVPPEVRKQIEHELRSSRRWTSRATSWRSGTSSTSRATRGILCQGRGSAANSAVCYALQITAIDPVRMGLLFERFLSMERKEPPDIDVDFEHERREEVLQYVYEKHGRHRAGMVCEVICYRGRLALREVGKALGLSLDQVDRLSKVVGGVRLRRDARGAGRGGAVRVRSPRAADADAGAGDRGLPAPPLHPRGRLRHHPRAAGGAGPRGERGDEGPHRHPVGEGRHQRAGRAQGGPAGAGHAHGGGQVLRAHPRALRPGAVAGHDPAGGSEGLRHAVRGGLGGRVPDREPRADEHAAEAQAAHLLRSGDRDRPHPPGAHRRQHGAPVPAAAGWQGGAHVPDARGASHPREDAGRAALPGAGDEAGHGGRQASRRARRTGCGGRWGTSARSSCWSPTASASWRAA